MLMKLARHITRVLQSLDDALDVWDHALLDHDAHDGFVTRWPNGEEFDVPDVVAV